MFGLRDQGFHPWLFSAAPMGLLGGWYPRNPSASRTNQIALVRLTRRSDSSPSPLARRRDARGIDDYERVVPARAPFPECRVVREWVSAVRGLGRRRCQRLVWQTYCGKDSARVCRAYSSTTSTAPGADSRAPGRSGDKTWRPPRSGRNQMVSVGVVAATIGPGQPIPPENGPSLFRPRNRRHPGAYAPGARLSHSILMFSIRQAWNRQSIC
jgi:hypothetical protein